MKKWDVLVKNVTYTITLPALTLFGKQDIQVNGKTVLTVPYRISPFTPCLYNFTIDEETLTFCKYGNECDIIINGRFVEYGHPFKNSIRNRFSVFGLLFALSILSWLLIVPFSPFLVFFDAICFTYILVQSFSPFGLEKHKKEKRLLLETLVCWIALLIWRFL